MLKSIVLFLLFLPVLLTAQSASKLGFGANLGYRGLIGDKGFTLEYKLHNSIDAYAGISYVKFNGFGYSIGSDVFFTKRGVQPFFGAAFSWQSGDSFYMGSDSLNRSDYKVESNSHLIGVFGGRMLIHFDDESVKSYMAILPYLSYRYELKKATALLTDGIYDADLDSRINSRIGSGFGLGIRFVYYFGRRAH